jgi:hypothetical protein
MARVTRNKGTTVVECYHPTKDDIYCDIMVKWRYFHEAGTFYEPEDEEYTFDSVKVVSFCGQPAQDMEIPDWVDWDFIQEQVEEDQMSSDGW